MKKKIALLTGALTIAFAVGAFAGSSVKLIVNGKNVAADVQIINGSSYVPLRVVSESLGAQVNWDGATRTITINAGGKVATPTPAPTKNKPTITKAEFDQIKDGMTYDQVVKIIGGPGELMSESGSAGDQFHTVMYMWDGDGNLGANANAMFQGGKLISKAQFGLK